MLFWFARIVGPNEFGLFGLVYSVKAHLIRILNICLMKVDKRNNALNFSLVVADEKLNSSSKLC